jgi:hypothetical protein
MSLVCHIGRLLPLDVTQEMDCSGLGPQRSFSSRKEPDKAAVPIVQYA